jgi:hypothetical protein
MTNTTITVVSYWTKRQVKARQLYKLKNDSFPLCQIIIHTTNPDGSCTSQTRHVNARQLATLQAAATKQAAA